MRPLRVACSLIVAGAACAQSFAQSAPPIAWQQTLDGGSSEAASAVDGDGTGHVYVSGTTDGGLDGPGLEPHQGFLAKYDTAGGLLWTRQLGTSLDDHISGVSADASGNVFIAGQTWGALDGLPLGKSDAFVAKYDAAGNSVWTRQFGTAESDAAFGVVADGLGNVYVSGSVNEIPIFPYPSDAFLRKYDGSGALLWDRQIGTSADDTAFNVATDGLGNFYAAGDTTGAIDGMNAGSYDAWLAKYDADGNELWRRQRGSSSADFVRDVAADGLGNIFLSGYSNGNLNGPPAGIYDAFVMKYDAAGNHVWTRQLGTTSQDESWGVTADGLGNVLISGSTDGALDGMNLGGNDAFVSMYDGAGSLVWTRQWGTVNDDGAADVWADGSGRVYVAGSLNSTGRSGTTSNAFLTKLATVPEPGALALASLVAATLCTPRLRRR